MRKLTSEAWPVKVLIRRASSAALKPELPPSPYISIGQTTEEPEYCQVPLSWVPPWALFCGRCWLTDRLWNCRVEKPAFMLRSWFGTRLSRLLQ